MTFPLELPHYQLGVSKLGQYGVVEWTKWSSGPWENDGEARQIAMVSSREAAMAVLRLFGAKRYHDWTVHMANWGMPVTEME